MRRGVQQLEIPFPEPGTGPPAALRRRVADLTARLVERARGQWPDTVLPDVRIEFRLRGRSAGEACSRTWTTNYNRELLEKHGEAFVEEIVPHEVAHLVAERLYGDDVKPHGAEWKSVMAFFGAKARASHDFEAPPAPEWGRFPYRCACRGTHWLTRRAHRSARRGHSRYDCTVCHTPLEYAGGGKARAPVSPRTPGRAAAPAPPP